MNFFFFFAFKIDELFQIHELFFKFVIFRSMWFSVFVNERDEQQKEKNEWNMHEGASDRRKKGNGRLRRRRGGLRQATTCGKVFC